MFGFVVPDFYMLSLINTEIYSFGLDSRDFNIWFG